MQPEQELEQIAPELIGSGAQAVVENAKRLGLTWTITLATVTSVDPVEAIADGDTAAIGMVSMIGSVTVGQRVYVIQVPPSGNFIVGFASGGIYRARQITTSTVASIVFSDIPQNLQSLRFLYTARGDSGSNVLQMALRIDDNSTASYFGEFGQVRNGAVSGNNINSGTSGLCGLTTGSVASVGVFATGAIDIQNWDSPPTSLGWTFQAQGLGNVITDFFTYWGGGIYVGSNRPYSSVSFFAIGSNFIANCDFQLEGIPSM